MNGIGNDVEFRDALRKLDASQQRVVAARFARHVLPVSTDQRLHRAVKIAEDQDVSGGELSSALDTALAATIDCHARCGAEGNWNDQAGYFVGRAVVATLTPVAQSRAGGPAWQAAMSARMAHTSMLIDDLSSGQGTRTECEWQYQALADYLASQTKRVAES